MNPINPTPHASTLSGTLPTLLTLGNVACGFGAITSASGRDGGDGAASLYAAGLLIYLAMVFDGLDGAAARWAGRTGEFGARLDSLSDAVSFGAAPAVLVVGLARSNGYQPAAFWGVAAVYVACAVLRLARFGAEAQSDREPDGFRGLPTPAAAAVVASFPALLSDPRLASGESWAGTKAWVVIALPFITLGVAALMVSRVGYRHLLRSRRGPRNRHRLVTLMAAGMAAAVPEARLLLACGYAFGPPAGALRKKLSSVILRRTRHQSEPFDVGGTPN